MTTSTGRRGYVGVARHWLADDRLTDGMLRLMLWLDSHSDEYLQALSVKRTADEIGWSRDRVKRTLDALEELGLVSTELVPHLGSGKRTYITLHLDAWTEGYATPQGTGMPHGKAQGMPHGKAPTTSTHNVGTNSQEPSTPTLFDAFWEQYPRKIGKAEARKSWSKVSAENQDIAIAVIGLHVQMWAAEGRGLDTIPHATTWLNQERWEDEVAFVAPRNTNSKAARSKAAIQRAVATHEPKALWS